MVGQDRLWTNLRVATLDPSTLGSDVVADGAIQVRDGRAAFVGFRKAPLADAVSRASINCHTLLVHGGDRARAGTGMREVGKSADLEVRDSESPAGLASRLRCNALHARVFQGERAPA